MDNFGLIFLLTMLFFFLWVAPIFWLGRIIKRMLWDTWKAERKAKEDRLRRIADRRG